ncbi:hypothetical protein ABE137_01090 [Brevibacillus laterosporus]|uniref:hypothetical protein n=1 Tax=Brevibacillus laterosporus TaxID=1465 RepID=UPI003D1ACAA8
MSLQKKLQRERAAGIEQATIASWDLFERALVETPGIGPKRKAAVIKTAIRLAQEKASGD